MKKLFFIAFVMSACCISTFAQLKTSNSIAEIRAHLVYEENGELSRDILKGDFTFWNTVIGEGDAEGHSSSTLVYVVISNDGTKDKTFPVLQFSAVSEDGKRVNYKKTFEYLFPTDGKSKVFVPFLLHDTGCQKIKLVAKLVNPKTPTKIYQTVRKEIPFLCGE